MVWFILFNLISPLVLAQPYEVLVEFWADKNMNEKYYEEIMKVYLQNKTYVGGDWDYNYTCYHANYENGLANITVEETGKYDLLITNGNIVWDEQGCPDTNENYEYWATVQSNLLIDEDKEFDYYINITWTGEQPRQFFWNTLSMGAVISAFWFLATFGLILGLEYWIVKQGQPPSGVLAIVILLVSIILKLVLGV
jgi:hypothetical protein